VQKLAAANRLDRWRKSGQAATELLVHCH